MKAHQVNIVEIEDDIRDQLPEDAEIISMEEIGHTEPMTQRSSARRMALQILYEVDLTQHHINAVIEQHQLHHPVPDKVRQDARRFASGTMTRRPILDIILAQFAPEFPLDQVAVVDRNILRLGLYELLINEQVPLNAVISEAVELAKLYGTEGSIRFVNGVLGSIGDNIEQVRRAYAAAIARNPSMSVPNSPDQNQST